MLKSGKTRTALTSRFPNHRTHLMEALETRRLLSVGGYAPFVRNEGLPDASVAPSNLVDHAPALIQQSDGANFGSETQAVQTVFVFSLYTDSRFDGGFSRPESKFLSPAQPDFRGFGEDVGSTTAIVIDAGWAGGFGADAAWTNSIGPSESFVLIETNTPYPSGTPSNVTTGASPIVSNVARTALAPKSFVENQSEPVRSTLLSDTASTGTAINSETSLVGEQNQNLFNETAIRHGVSGIASGTFQSRGAEALNSLNAVALSSPALANWVTGSSASISSWLVAAEGANPVAAVERAVKASGETAMAAGASAASAVAHAATTITSAMANAPLSIPAGIVYRFANFDPSTTFSDAMSDFARDAASMSTTATAVPTYHASQRAWVITGSVLGVDALLVANWYADRVRKLKAKKQASASSSQSPQAGPLPTGL